VSVINSDKKNLHFILNAAVATFVTYLCMYAFRKPFTAATFNGLKLWGFNYKILLIIAQLIGYTLSKSLGIKIIAELRQENRLKTLIILMGIAMISLLLFALVPFPYNLLFMFLNGIPLGMIWGVVFGFIEGRKSTELLGAIMASSFIVSSGLVKSSGRLVLENIVNNEMWMPFITALIYTPVLLFGIYLLSRIKAPGEDDKLLRTARIPMNANERKNFIIRFAPGIVFSILIYVFLTIFRDMRDNFAVEFWISLGYSQTPELLAFSEFPIAIVVMVIIASMILIKNNRIAFHSNNFIAFFCGILLVLTTVLFYFKMINGIVWMMLAGFFMYLPYIGFHTLYFERWIAHFKYKSNAGFLMSMADTAGYLGSTIILLIKNFATPDVSWIEFFEVSAVIVGFSIISLSFLNYRYFLLLEKKSNLA
jgi:hypothetical protein